MMTGQDSAHEPRGPEFFDTTAARIVADTLDAVIYADRTGAIRLWNAGAERIFGHSAADALGQSLDMIIPDKHRGAHWNGWDRVMASGETKYGSDPLSVPGVRADGSRVSLEFSITMFKDSEGRVEGVAAVMRDVGKSWREKQDLRERVRELEKQLNLQT